MHIYDKLNEVTNFSMANHIKIIHHKTLISLHYQALASIV